MFDKNNKHAEGSACEQMSNDTKHDRDIEQRQPTKVRAKFPLVVRLRCYSTLHMEHSAVKGGHVF